MIIDEKQKGSDLRHNFKKEPFVFYLELSGGGRGIRTHGPAKVNGFQDDRIRPLCHSSTAKV